MKKSHNQNQGQKKITLKKLKISKLTNLESIKGGAAVFMTTDIGTDTFTNC
ncbi:hypothetical protein U6A24_05830 [Aquimarina gracilis]|uniref:Natural product n=1 Tax=Aquimarina gracilis TaxID=874422 RepID=A0ABU5ZSD0_9FLAO|nr:hypothetical protein [Aquimarina gracilis]MEB3344970.1 hypothetical protein [Aquimarina gracilis]